MIFGLPSLKRLDRVVRLPVGEKLLLTAAVFLRILIAVGLRCLPFRCWRRLLARTLQPRPVTRPAVGGWRHQAAEKWDRVLPVVSAMGRCERLVPVGGCLARALTGYVLLTWMRQPCRLHLGVGWKPGRQLWAHAWLESGGQVIIGGPFQGLTALPVSAPHAPSVTDRFPPLAA